MRILLKIVYRNLKEHKIKTLIIGVIVSVGMYVLVAGNTVIDTVTAGISKNFIEYNTGHIAVFPSILEAPSLVGGGPEMMTDDGVVPIIRDYKDVLDAIEATPGVVAVSPQISGMATLQFGDEGNGFSQLLAVDPDRYRTFFPDNIDLVEGRFLEPGEEGIVLSTNALEMLGESSAETISVGDSVLLTSMSNVAGMKIREVPIVGIFDVTVASQMMTSYLDGENMRALNGMTQITDIEAVLTAEEQSGLGAVDEDALFGGGDDFIVVANSDASEEVDELFTSASIVQEAALELYNAIDSDAWHYVLIRLEEGASIRQTVGKLNDSFAASGLEVIAYTWLDAAGQVAQMTNSLRLIFNIVIIVIAIVSVIIIMNTLVISVTERIGEIGTMRAIGAQKSFVRRMIVMETVVIAIVFGGIGILLGAITIVIVAAAQIETQNMILQMLVGGSIIRPTITALSIFTSLFGLLVAGVVASYYPAVLALRIEPRQAMAAH